MKTKFTDLRKTWKLCIVKNHAACFHLKISLGWNKWTLKSLALTKKVCGQIIKHSFSGVLKEFRKLKAVELPVTIDSNYVQSWG